MYLIDRSVGYDKSFEDYKKKMLLNKSMTFDDKIKEEKRIIDRFNKIDTKIRRVL